MSLEKSSAASLRELVAAVAGPRSWSDTRESWLARAARRSTISFRQIRAIFYGELIDPDHPAARKLRDAAVRLGRSETADLAGRFETVTRALAAADADFYRADVAALLSAARALRGLDMAQGDEGDLADGQRIND